MYYNGAPVLPVSLWVRNSLVWNQGLVFTGCCSSGLSHRRQCGWSLLNFINDLSPCLYSLANSHDWATGNCPINGSFKHFLQPVLDHWSLLLCPSLEFLSWESFSVIPVPALPLFPLIWLLSFWPWPVIGFLLDFCLSAACPLTFGLFPLDLSPTCPPLK